MREAREAELRQKMHELREQGFSVRKISEALDIKKDVVQRYFDSLKVARSDVSKRNSFETRQREDSAPTIDDSAEVEPRPSGTGDEPIEQVGAWDRPINRDDDYGNPPERDDGPGEPLYSTGADGLPPVRVGRGRPPHGRRPTHPAHGDETRSTRAIFSRLGRLGAQPLFLGGVLEGRADHGRSLFRGPARAGAAGLRAAS